MRGPRCTKGKSCGATCIDARERCNLELGPLVSPAVGKASMTLGALFNQGIAAGKEKASKRPEFTPLPTDIKNQLAALAPRQLSRSPGAQTRTPFAARQELANIVQSAKKGDTSLIWDDISRIMRGSLPQNLQVASAGDELGMRARVKPTEIRKVERQLESALGSKARPSMNVDQLREAAAKQANELSLQREKATNGAERKALRDRIEKLDAAVKRADELNATATGNTRWARVEAKDFDNALGKVRREGNTAYNGWGDSYGSGATKIGEGSYGTVIRNKDGTFVKRGDISNTEAELIGRLGKIDLGPKLVAADINGPAQYHTERSVDMKNGRIAMGQVPGEPIGKIAAPNTQIGGKNAADIYWKAMADLHRQGIAHNDAHIDNILVDGKGKGRWVDLGLAQASPKAALAEAMGIFKPLKGGDDITLPSGATGEGNWQTARWNATGVSQAEQLKREGRWAQFQQRFPVASRVWDNQEKVIKKMEEMGMDVNEINSVITHGIRSSPESYTKSDGFNRMTDAQAQDLIKTLYDGI